MAKIEVLNKDGKKVSQLELNAKIAEANPAMAVVHRTVVAEEANARQGTQSAKTRSEVRGGGRKPYKQKKTGNARQGTTRAPHYAHGGMALAVKPRDYTKKVNRKERRAAILGAFNAKVVGGAVTVVDAIVFAEPKTKPAAELLAKLGLNTARRLLIVLPAIDLVTYKCFRNMPNVTVKTAPSNEEAAKTDVFSTRDLLIADKILVAQDAMKKIEEVWCS